MLLSVGDIEARIASNDRKRAHSNTSPTTSASESQLLEQSRKRAKYSFSNIGLLEDFFGNAARFFFPFLSTKLLVPSLPEDHSKSQTTSCSRVLFPEQVCIHLLNEGYIYDFLCLLTLCLFVPCCYKVFLELRNREYFIGADLVSIF